MRAMRRMLPWLGLLVLFLAVRIWAGWPAGVDRDENQQCWNARCLAWAGTDFLGNPHPLVLEDYGDDKHALYAWLLAGVERLGIEVRPERARVFSAGLVGLAALLAGLAFAVHTGSRRWGLLTMAAVAFLPWFQVGPCLSWELSTSPPGWAAMLLGLALLAQGRWRRSGIALTVGGLAFAVYGYPAPKVLAPLVLAGASLLVPRTWRGRAGLFALGSFLLLPLLLDNLVIPSHTDRARLILVKDAGTFVTNYLSHYLPPFLAYEGDRLPRHFAGFLGVVPIPLLVAALLLVVQAAWRRRWLPEASLDRFVLLLFLVYPLPAALTEDGHGHLDRTLLGGLVWVWAAMQGLRALRPRGVVTALVVLTGMQCAAHLWYLHARWRDAPTTAAVFHGTFYGDLRAIVPKLAPARVFFSPLPELAASAFPLIHFGWTALGSRPVPGKMHAHVPGHVATTGRPEVDVWLGQAAVPDGPDVLVQMAGVPPPPGFEPAAQDTGGVRFWIRPAAEKR